MSPSQHLSLSGQGETSSPTRRVNQRSSSQPKTPPSQNGPRDRRSKSRSKSPTSSKTSAPRQFANADRNGSELPSLASGQSDPIPTSPPWYPQCYKGDPSSEGSDDPDDPCLKIRHGRRRLRLVLKELQEMHRAAIAENVASELENERLQNDNERLREANQNLRNDYQDLADESDHFRFLNRQIREAYQELAERFHDQRCENRQATTRLQDLVNEVHDLRETNETPQNEDADLRIENRNLRNQVQQLWTENEQLRGDANQLHDDIHDLRKQLRGAAATENEARRLRGQLRDAGDATGESRLLSEQLEDLDVELHETYQHLNRANNEINRLQATLDWIHQDGSDRATSHPTTPSRSMPRGSSASRSASSPGSQAPESSPSPSPPRRVRNVRTAAAPTRRMNARDQVNNVDNSRTPPLELFSPQRAGTQQSNGSKPAGVSKTAQKTKRSRK